MLARTRSTNPEPGNDSRRMELSCRWCASFCPKNTPGERCSWDTMTRLHRDDERTAFRSYRESYRNYVLDDRRNLRVRRPCSKVSLRQRDAVRQNALQTLLRSNNARVDIVVDELQNEVVPGIRDGEILLKDLVQALALTVSASVSIWKKSGNFKLATSSRSGIGNPVLDCRKATFCCVFAGHRKIQIMLKCNSGGLRSPKLRAFYPATPPFTRQNSPREHFLPKTDTAPVRHFQSLDQEKA